jgi:hypothetical protein
MKAMFATPPSRGRIHIFGKRWKNHSILFFFFSDLTKIPLKIKKENSLPLSLTREKYLCMQSLFDNYDHFSYL